MNIYFPQYSEFEIQASETLVCININTLLTAAVSVSSMETKERREGLYSLLLSEREDRSSVRVRGLRGGMEADMVLERRGVSSGERRLAG